ncbi:MAG: helix-turn-helix domain-containing protein [Gammaproteobacteria bacterium]
MSEQQLHEVRTSAGETLKQLRMEKNLSVRDIALQLHLEPRIIEALEEGNFELLPAATYIRGYLRNYAKIVSADADTVISLYNDKAPEPPEIIPDVKHSSQISSSDKPVKAFTYLITFIMVLLLFAWLQSNFIVKQGGPGRTGENFPGSINEPELNPASTAPETPAPADLSSYNEENESEQETVSEEGIQAGGLNGQVEPDLSRTSPETAEALTDDSTDSALSPAAESKLEHAEAAETSGPDTIRLRLTADSWIEIYDKDDNKLYLNLARAGDEINVNGTAPFDVKLGFSQGVILEFNGKPFDPAPYSHAGIARFTLGD